MGDNETQSPKDWKRGFRERRTSLKRKEILDRRRRYTNGKRTSSKNLINDKKQSKKRQGLVEKVKAADRTTLPGKFLYWILQF